jgi:protein ImuB
VEAPGEAAGPSGTAVACHGSVARCPPRRFEWRGASYQVASGEGPERIHGEWWRNEREMWAVRDYFMVEAQTGERFWLFRRGDGVDAPTGDLSWYLHGLFG